MPRYTRYAYDQEPLTGAEAAVFVKMLLDRLPPEEADELRRRLPALIEDQPRPGSSLDPDRRAEDARRRHYAQDSRPFRPTRVTAASSRAFDQRFPDARRIGHL